MAAIPPYHRGVGPRVIRSKAVSGPVNWREVRSPGAIISAVGLPVLLMGALLSSDVRTDLSELKPRNAVSDTGTTMVGWPELELRSGEAEQARLATWRSAPRVRMLGYMMDGYHPSRDGAEAGMFILVPEAGQLMHPAHRIPEEMVEVWLGRPVPFEYRKLVWATGIMTRKSGRLKSEEVL